MSATQIARPASKLGDCVSCGLPLPLRIAGADEAGSAWECVRCGAVYFAVMAEDSVFGVRTNVRPLESARFSSEKGTPARDFSALIRAASAPRLWEAPPVKPAVVSVAESRFTRGLDAHIDAGWGAELPSHGPAFARQVVRHGAVPVSPRLALQFTAQTNRNADQLSSFLIACNSARTPIWAWSSRSAARR